MNGFPNGDVLQGILLTAVMLSALVVASGRRTLRFGCVLAALALVAQWLSMPGAEGVWSWLCFLPALAFISLVIAQRIIFVLGTSEGNVETLCAGIPGFLLIGILGLHSTRFLEGSIQRLFSFLRMARSWMGDRSSGCRTIRKMWGSLPRRKDWINLRRNVAEMSTDHA